MRKILVGLVGVVLAMTTVQVVAAAPASADVPNFAVGFQLIDGGGRRGQGPLKLTPALLDGGGTTGFVGDSNNFDPDGGRIGLFVRNGISNGLDFRLSATAFDDGGRIGGTSRLTAWASEGSSNTGVVTDNNGFDPDVYQIGLQVRLLPPGAQLNDVQLTVTAFDDGLAGPTQVTPWLSQGGGLSPYAFDANFFDPDGFIFGINVA